MPRTQSLVRLAAVVYGAILTVFLLVPDPAALIGLERPPVPSGGRGVHFVLFTMLAVLFSIAHWPLRRSALAAALGLYAVAIESLQAIVPLRTVELLDYAENLIGLGLGLGLCRLLQRPRGANEARPPEGRPS